MRDESVGKGINLIGTVVVALLIVGVLLVVAYFVIGKVNTAKEDVGNQADAALAYKYEMYDQEIVTGSDVLAAIQKFKNDTIYITVNNGLTTTSYNYTYTAGTGFTPIPQASVVSPKNKNDLQHYINPSSQYLGKVVHQNDDPKDVVVGIEFEKQTTP